MTICSTLKSVVEDVRALCKKFTGEYKGAPLEILKMAVGTGVVAVLLLLAPCGLKPLVGHPTAFDTAAELLAHYGYAVPQIILFFYVNLLLLIITFVLREKWGEWARKWALLPALRVSQHWFGLSLGVFFASTIIEIVLALWGTRAVPLGSWRDLLDAWLVATFVLLSHGSISKVVAEFFESDYLIVLQQHGKFFRPCVIVAAIVISWVYPGFHTVFHPRLVSQSVR